MLKVLAQLRGQQMREDENKQAAAGGGDIGGSGGIHQPLSLLIAGGKGRTPKNPRC